MRGKKVGAIVLTALGILIMAAPVAAFPLTNCTLQLTSIAKDGTTLGTVTGGAPDATQADPFLVDWDGTISYTGTSEIAMKDNTWGVSVFTFPTPLQGGDDNPGDDREGSGTVGVSANAPFRFTGLYYVSGSLTGSGGTCAGSGWFKLTGDPIGTIPFFAALGVLILGVAMLFLGSRRHTITAIVGGLLTGLGATVMLVLYSTLPLGERTPLVLMLAGLILGVAVGFLGRRGGGATVPPPTMPPTASA
jgi:hypothetical protein